MPINTHWQDHYRPPKGPTEVKELSFSEDRMHVYLSDGRILSVPLSWFPRLQSAGPEQRLKYEVIDGGWIRWPDLDEDIGLDGLLKKF